MNPATPEGMELKAFLHKDGRHFTMAGKLWRNTYPIEQLAKWFRFYETLADPKKNKKSHDKYTQTRDALVSVKAQLAAWQAKQEENHASIS